MATLRVHDSTEYWKKTDLMVKPASYPMAVGYDVPSVDTIHRPLTLDLSEVCHEDRVYWAVRRAQDILLSSLALVALSPLLLVTYAAIWIDSPGASPIFTQQRVGRNGKLFKMYKFRTMYVNAEENGPSLSSEDDLRVTPFGRIMRKYRLDELPQFWNVLKGDMSLVGPRPERKYFIDEIVKTAPYYYLLHNVRPGITSLGMVKYGYAASVDKMVERMEYDILYYENMSLTLDLTILIYTVKTVITGKGV
mgnify:CR=1 FL=1